LLNPLQILLLLLLTKLQIFVDDYAATICGTKLYMAPEVFQQRYNAKADVFSMGLVLYVMVTRCKIVSKRKEIFGLMINGMFIGKCLQQNHRKYMEQLFQEEVWRNPQYSELQGMIELMLTPDPQERPSSDELKPYDRDIEDDDEDLQEGTDEEFSSSEELDDEDFDNKQDHKGLKVLIDFGVDLLKRLMN